MAKVRMHIELNETLDRELEAIAKDEGTTKSEIMRRSFSIIKAFKEQAKRGRPYMGFVSDVSKLDAEMVGILTANYSNQNDAGKD